MEEGQIGWHLSMHVYANLEAYGNRRLLLSTVLMKLN